MAASRFGVEALVIGPGVKTGMPILTNDPRTVGPDLIVDAVAAQELYGAPCIAVDFGTATTYSAVSAAGEYLGHAIAPGHRDLAGCSRHQGRPPDEDRAGRPGHGDRQEHRAVPCRRGPCTASPARWTASWPACGPSWAATP